MIQENTFPHPLPNSASSQEHTCSSVVSSRSCSPFDEIPALEWAYPPPATPPDWSTQHPTLTFISPCLVFLTFLKCVFRGTTSFSNELSCVLRWSHFRVGWNQLCSVWAALTSHQGQPCSLFAPPPPPKPCHINPIQILLFLNKATILAGFF